MEISTKTLQYLALLLLLIKMVNLKGDLSKLCSDTILSILIAFKPLHIYSGVCSVICVIV